MEKRKKKIGSLCEGLFCLIVALFFLILLGFPLFLRYQITVDLPHVAYGGRTNHQTCGSEKPSYR